MKTNKKYKWTSFRIANTVLNHLLSRTDQKAQEKPLSFKHEQFNDGQIGFILEYRSSLWARYTAYTAPYFRGHIIDAPEGSVIIVKRCSFMSRLSNLSTFILTAAGFVRGINRAVTYYYDPVQSAGELISISTFFIFMGALAVFLIWRYIRTYREYSDLTYLLEIIKNAAGIY